MAVTTLVNLSEEQLTIRYRQPYLSKSLNSKFQSLLSPGIYDGLELAPGAAALTLQVSTGSASVTSSAGAQYQVSVQLDGGQLLSLATLASKTVYIGIEADYLFPTTTTGAFKAYEEGVDSIPAYACILGRVVVPASGTIPLANISLTNRTLPWDTRGRDAVPFVNTVKNGDFGFAVPLAVPEFWEASGSAGTLLAEASTGLSGFGNVVRAKATSAHPIAQTAALVQYLGVPINPDRDRLRISVGFRAIQNPSNGVYPGVVLYFKTPNDNSSLTGSPIVLPLTALASVGSFTLFQQTYELSNLLTYSARGLYLEKVAVEFRSATYASTVTTAFQVSDLKVELESRSGAVDPQHEMGGTQRLTRLNLVDPSNPSANGSYASFVYNSSTDTLQLTGPSSPSVSLPDDLSVADDLTVGGDTNIGGTLLVTGAATFQNNVGITGNLNVTGSTSFGSISTTTLTATTQVVTPDLDSTGALYIGWNTQTALNMGRPASATVLRGLSVSLNTPTTNISGDLYVNTNKFIVMGSAGNTYTAGTAEVTGLLTAQSGILSNNDIQIASSYKLITGEIDTSIFGGTLDIGHTNAGIVTIGVPYTGTVLFSYSSTRIVSANAASIPLWVRGATGQTANLTEWQGVGGTLLSSVSSNGNFRTSSSYDTETATVLNLAPSNATRVSSPKRLVLTGAGLAAGEASLEVYGENVGGKGTGPMQRWLNAGGSVAVEIDSAGHLSFVTANAIDFSGSGFINGPGTLYVYTNSSRFSGPITADDHINLAAAAAVYTSRVRGLGGTLSVGVIGATNVVIGSAGNDSVLQGRARGQYDKDATTYANLAFVSPEFISTISPDNISATATPAYWPTASHTNYTELTYKLAKSGFGWTNFTPGIVYCLQIGLRGVVTAESNYAKLLGFEVAASTGTVYQYGFLTAGVRPSNDYFKLNDGISGTLQPLYFSVSSYTTVVRVQQYLPAGNAGRTLTVDIDTATFTIWPVKQIGSEVA